MSPEAQRIAIAEACGFRKVSEIFCDWEKTEKWATPRRYFRPPDCAYGDKLHPHQLWGWQEPQPWAGNTPQWGGVPDYLNDLNAMHEAEKVLSRVVEYDSNRERCPSEYEKYDWKLHQMRGGSATSATAAQRAEAFLRTIGKWDDSK